MSIKVDEDDNCICTCDCGCGCDYECDGKCGSNAEIDCTCTCDCDCICGCVCAECTTDFILPPLNDDITTSSVIYTPPTLGYLDLGVNNRISDISTLIRLTHLSLGHDEVGDNFGGGTEH